MSAATAAALAVLWPLAGAVMVALLGESRRNARETATLVPNRGTPRSIELISERKPKNDEFVALSTRMVNAGSDLMTSTTLSMSIFRSPDSSSSLTAAVGRLGSCEDVRTC